MFFSIKMHHNISLYSRKSEIEQTKKSNPRKNLRKREGGKRDEPKEKKRKRMMVQLERGSSVVFPMAVGGGTDVCVAGSNGEPKRF